MGKIQTHERFIRMLLITTKHNMWIFTAIPLSSYKTTRKQVKWWKVKCRSKPFIWFWLSCVVLAELCCFGWAVLFWLSCVVLAELCCFGWAVLFWLSCVVLAELCYFHVQCLEDCWHQHSPKHRPLSPFLTGRMFVRPNILRTLRRTMIRFLIEHLVRRIWFGQSKLYFILNWLVMRCKLRPELVAHTQQTAWSKM